MAPGVHVAGHGREDARQARHRVSRQTSHGLLCQSAPLLLGAALVTDYDRVFWAAAALALVIAMVSVLLQQHRRS